MLIEMAKSKSRVNGSSNCSSVLRESGMLKVRRDEQEPGVTVAWRSLMSRSHAAMSKEPRLVRILDLAPTS